MFQALTSDSIDFALGTGADMAFTAKGAPMMAVAAFARDARSVTIAVLDDSPIKTAADLKGKLVAMPGVGSVGDWLVRQMSIQEGWGPDGVKMLPLGSAEANLAALRTRQVDATIISAETVYLLETQHVARMVVNMAKYEPNFFGHTITARSNLIAQNPDLVNRFLKGFFASIAFIKANKAKTVEISSRLLRLDPAIVSRTYDEQVTGLEDDGTFDPRGIEVAKQSFIDTGILTEKPADDKILTTRFLPVKP
jgi:NitT/TauT family transport system substrate-binding protein